MHVPGIVNQRLLQYYYYVSVQQGHNYKSQSTYNVRVDVCMHRGLLINGCFSITITYLYNKATIKTTYKVRVDVRMHAPGNANQQLPQSTFSSPMSKLICSSGSALQS